MSLAQVLIEACPAWEGSMMRERSAVVVSRARFEVILVSSPARRRLRGLR
jgi:hypothetical protein